MTANAPKTLRWVATSPRGADATEISGKSEGEGV